MRRTVFCRTTGWLRMAGGAAGSTGSASPSAEATESRVDGKLAKVKKELEAAKKDKQEYLDGWQRAAADHLGLARVTGQDVLAALVDRLLADSELSDQIVQNIAERRS